MATTPRGHSGGCLLEEAVGLAGSCPGPVCPFWDEPAARCAVGRDPAELLSRPEVAEFMLELRRALEAGGEEAERAHAEFFHRLNLEDMETGGSS